MRFQLVTATALLIASAGTTIAATAAAADYFVRSLPGQPKDVPLIKMHAGYATGGSDAVGESLS
jgi:hypothetical protein